MKKFLLFFAALLLCIALLPAPALAVQMSAGAVVNSGANLTGTQVYFGSYDSTVNPSGVHNGPIRWYVVAKDGTNTATLWTTTSMGNKHYDPSSAHRLWKGSDICAWLNGTIGENLPNNDHTTNGFLPRAFSPAERAAILNYGETETTNGHTININQKIVLPSVAEIGDLNNTGTWGITPTNRALDASGAVVSSGVTWWLRSPGGGILYAVVAGPNGYVNTTGSSVSNPHAIRPAFNLNLSSVLFTSAAAGGKSSATIGDGFVGASVPTGAVKFTVLDSGLTLTVDVAQQDERTVKAGDTVSIAYSGAQTGANKYVSCVIENSGSILFYGKLADTVSGTASFTVPPVSALPGGTYTIKLFNEECNGDNLTDFASTPISIPLTVIPVPGAPTGVSATAGNGQATVTFTAPANDGGSAITGYTVTSNPGGITATGASSPITVTGLTNGTSYTFTVTATNIAGTGAASAASNAVTPMTVPNAPTGVSATAGNGQATVTFTPPADNGGSAITGYTVTSNSGGVTASGAASPITVTGLTNGTAYTFTVAATNIAGTGPASAASNSVTPAAPATVPGAPTGVSATAGNGQATVTFAAPANNGSAITGYTVTSNPGDITATGTASPITVTGLTNGTAYTFTVTATNIAGTGPASAASNSVTPTDGTPNPGTRTLPGGAKIDYPAGTIITDDTITLPSGAGGTATAPGGAVIELPGGTVIKPDGTITPPPGWVVTLNASDGVVSVKISGSIKIESDGTITLIGTVSRSVTITTGDETKIVLSNGKISEYDSISKTAAGAEAVWSLSATPRYFYVLVGKGGAEVIRNGSTETVLEGSVITIDPDGVVEVLSGETPNEPSIPGETGSGCNAGFGMFGVLALTVLGRKK